MTRYYHGNRRHAAVVVASVLLLLVASLIYLTASNKNGTANMYVSLSDIVTFASDTWNSPTEGRIRQRRQLQTAPTVQVQGELKKWHKVTLAIQGPMSEENHLDNPFTNYRLDVTFVHTLTGTTYKIPGYYAADGDAANTGAKAGNIWYVHFAPDQTGEWTYAIDFQGGVPFIAIQNNAQGVPVTPAHQTTGTFNIENTDKTGRDHRGKGRLRYVGKQHMQFQETGEYFLKAGSDSPENFLAYNDFDNTPNNGNRRKSWAPHIQHFVEGTDPIWKINKGKGIIGALNYLSSQGMNAFSFLTFNVNGDDENVFPYMTPTNRYRFDVSKLAQWEIVFEHADKVGMMLHFKTFEQENDQLLDGGDLGQQRKLYYRELVARFSHHLALVWNLGEEITNTVDQIKDISRYITAVDPYDHVVLAHTPRYATFFEDVAGIRAFSGISIQALPTEVYGTTLTWLQVAENSNHKWIVSNDEQANGRTGVVPDSVDPTHDVIRQNSLWGNIMAGGAGVEYYFGYSYENSDLTCEDFSSRANMWQQSKFALEFFSKNKIPFQDMISSNNSNSVVPVKLPATSKDWLLSLKNSLRHVIYRKIGNAPGATLTGLPLGSYNVRWYNPRAGGPLQVGSITSLTVVNSSDIVSYGTPPSTPTLDWVVHVQKMAA